MFSKRDDYHNSVFKNVLFQLSDQEPDTFVTKTFDLELNRCSWSQHNIPT
jgi:hypothetical protein